MSHPAPPDEKTVRGADSEVPARDVNVAWTGDERVEAVGGEKEKILVDDKKPPVTMDQASMPGGNEKMRLADEELARQLQDEWDREGPQPSGPRSTTSGRVTAVDDKGRDHQQPASYAPPPGTPPSGSNHHIQGSVHSRYTRSAGHARPHTNEVIAAGKLRAINEQEMQNWLQRLQYQYRIYNSEIDPEHESDLPCSCPVHQYMRAKWARADTQDRWNAAVLYPGERAYNSNRYYNGTSVFSGNPYQYRTMSPYAPFSNNPWGPKVPSAKYHATWISQTIALNNSLNAKAQNAIDAKEPQVDIWNDAPLDSAMSQLGVNDKPLASTGAASQSPGPAPAKPPSKLSKFRQSIGIKSNEERQVSKLAKDVDKGRGLRDSILDEEQGRWPDEQWREIIQVYQEKTGMAKKIAHLRARQPIQYLHLLRAGYFEPIPVAWANSNSNPLKFSIEAASGWRGITPTWRGYEDTAEERLYWVLNHREGSIGTRMKPDFISALDMARERMASAVEPPPEYYDDGDVCHVQHTSKGYSKQVMPAPFQAYDRPETAADDTMILLDVSGSMDFEPQRPIYDRYLVTGFRPSTQPKNKDVAKAIIRRFTDAMMNHDHATKGYDLTVFSSQARYIGTVNHRNLDGLWRTIEIGGGTRVMTGWQKVKELHFKKHSASAIHHPVYGWQAGPQTPILRLLLLLDGEATDMDEFELDLLGLSWAHVTIFLIGVDGCPHHHRHANELQRISDVNHHVSFVDAQGNTPERFVTHELLKRHLGYDVSLQDFKDMEIPPLYSE